MADIYDPVYVAVVAVFVLGLFRMGNPRTAKSGILWAGLAMLAAILVTFTIPSISNIPLILIGIAVGGAIGWVAAVRVAMVNMPQMIAIYNGMGAGAASAIATIELVGFGASQLNLYVAFVGAAIGNVSIAGSIIAFLKLQGWMKQRPFTFGGQQILNIALFAAAIICGVIYLTDLKSPYSGLLILFTVFSLGYGFLMALPIGGADMPVIIALFNAMTGIAVAFDGFSISNYAMVVAGIFVGAAGSILTIAMARAMNRSLPNVLFGKFVTPEGTSGSSGEMKSIEPEDAAILLDYAERIIIVPGYGMAAAQAQFKVKELLDLLLKRGIKVSFAIHPVAGRMPGHMNVLLAEAGVPYELQLDLEEVNKDFANTDVSLVVGANDVVNPAAREKGSPLYGMPIVDVDSSRNIIVLKRGGGKGYSGIVNDLFTGEKTRMLYGDATESMNRLIQELKKI